MRKAIIIIVIIIIGTGAFLGWDWYNKAQKQKLEPSITLYYWTDAEGNKHVSDVAPPQNAKNVYTDKGHKYIPPPLIVTIKNKAFEYYRETKKKLFRADETKTK
ncbi:MAG: DUF4124 domain-containing protein [Deltaproteobacteria bacterium]|jgi:hypothetical protein